MYYGPTIIFMNLIVPELIFESKTFVFQRENLCSGILEDISRLHSFRVSDLLLPFCLPPDMCGDKMQKENPR